MPAQDIFEEIEKMRVKQEKFTESLTVMHGALTQIARCEVSLDGGIAQKHIAETALIEVNTIAKGLEVQNA